MKRKGEKKQRHPSTTLVQEQLKAQIVLLAEEYVLSSYTAGNVHYELISILNRLDLSVEEENEIFDHCAEHIQKKHHKKQILDDHVVRTRFQNMLATVKAQHQAYREDPVKAGDQLAQNIQRAEKKRSPEVSDFIKELQSGANRKMNKVILKYCEDPTIRAKVSYLERVSEGIGYSASSSSSSAPPAGLQLPTRNPPEGPPPMRVSMSQSQALKRERLKIQVMLLANEYARLPKENALHYELMKKLNELQLTQAEEKSLYADCEKFIRGHECKSFDVRLARLNYLQDTCFNQNVRNGPQFSSLSFDERIEKANLSRDQTTKQLIKDIEFFAHPEAEGLLSQQKSSDALHTFGEKVSKGIGSPGLLNSSSEPSAELPRGSQPWVPSSSRSTPSSALPSSQSFMDFKQAASKASKETPELVSRSSLANSNKSSPNLPDAPAASPSSISGDSNFRKIPLPLSSVGAQKRGAPEKPPKSFKKIEAAAQLKEELQKAKESDSDEKKEAPESPKPR